MSENCVLVPYDLSVPGVPDLLLFKGSDSLKQSVLGFLEGETNDITLAIAGTAKALSALIQQLRLERGLDKHESDTSAANRFFPELDTELFLALWEVMARRAEAARPTATLGYLAMCYGHDWESKKIVNIPEESDGKYVRKTCSWFLLTALAEAVSKELSMFSSDNNSHFPSSAVAEVIPELMSAAHTAMKKVVGLEELKILNQTYSKEGEPSADENKGDGS